jgi:cobalamin synthase
MSAALPDPASRAAPLAAGAAAVGRAVRALTILGGNRPAAQIDASAVYYPLVGLAVGALWVATDRLVTAAAGRISASVAVVLVAALVTRARPLLALGRLLAALPAGAARRLAVLESGRGGLVSVSVAVVAAVEVLVLCALDRFRLVGVLFAPVLASCSIVVLAVGSRAARADGRRLKFAPDVTFREFGIATTATFALVFLTAEFLGLLLVLATAVLTVAARVFFHRWIDGVNETAVLAAAEAIQILILALLVIL